MATNRRKRIEKIRQVEGTLRVMESGDKKLYRVEIKALNGLVNRNGWQYTRLREHLNEFRDIPILTAYTMGGKKIGDGHNFEMRRDPQTGKEYPSFTAADAERIVGWVPSDANIRIEEIDGTEWVVVTGNLWRWYSPELVEKISRQGAMSISIETLVTAEHKDGDVEVEDEYNVLGITVLGDDVRPAVAGANIKSLATLKAMRETMQTEILKAASYMEKPTKTFKGVKNNMGDLSKRQLTELNTRFEDYTVLDAVQDDNGIHVCLMAVDGAAAIYTLSDINDTIMPEKIEKIKADAIFDFGNEVIVGVDTALMQDILAAEIVNLRDQLCKANAAAESATTELNAMREAENRRRLSAGKDKANSTLDNFNRNHAEKVEKSVIDPILTDISNGVYTNCTADDGTWNGESVIEEKVLAACARIVMDAEQKAADEKASIHIWDKIKSNAAAPDGTVGSLLSRKNIL